MKRLLLAAVFVAGIARADAQTELSPLLGTMNADNVTLYPGLQSYPNGGFHPMGLIYTIPAISGTGTGTGAQTLATYSLPAHALDVTGRKLRLTADFATAANTHTKTCTLNFGVTPSTVSTGAMATSAESAQLTMTVTRTAASLQTVVTGGLIATTPLSMAINGVSAENDAVALPITVICTDGTSAANDAVLADFFVEYMN